MMICDSEARNSVNQLAGRYVQDVANWQWRPMTPLLRNDDLAISSQGLAVSEQMDTVYTIEMLDVD